MCRRYFCRVSQLLFIAAIPLHVASPLCAIEYQDGLDSLPRHCEHEWVSCVIPCPPVQAVGTALVASGIIDMIDAAKEQGDQNEREEQANPQNKIPAEYERERLDQTQPH